MMDERLEVRLPAATMRVLRREAAGRGMPVARLVREAIEFMLTEDRAARVRAAEALFRAEAPVADWETMKREIEAGYLAGSPP